MAERAAGGSRVPIPLIAVAVLFVVAIVYLVAASLTRRTAPVYAASPADRVRAADWETAGDTLTIDATDDAVWRYVSLKRGRVLELPDTSGWDLAVRRYRVIARGEIADVGVVSFARVKVAPESGWVASSGVGGGRENAAIGHWYRYNWMTHLLEPDGRVFVVRGVGGSAGSKGWKVQVVSYYCPGLRAGCLTIRYAPVGDWLGLGG